MSERTDRENLDIQLIDKLSKWTCMATTQFILKRKSKHEHVSNDANNAKEQQNPSKPKVLIITRRLASPTYSTEQP